MLIHCIFFFNKYVIFTQNLAQSVLSLMFCLLDHCQVMERDNGQPNVGEDVYTSNAIKNILPLIVPYDCLLP